MTTILNNPRKPTKPNPYAAGVDTRPSAIDAYRQRQRRTIAPAPDVVAAMRAEPLRRLLAEAPTAKTEPQADGVPSGWTKVHDNGRVIACEKGGLRVWWAVAGGHFAWMGPPRPGHSYYVVEEGRRFDSPAAAFAAAEAHLAKQAPVRTWRDETDPEALGFDGKARA